MIRYVVIGTSFSIIMKLYWTYSISLVHIYPTKQAIPCTHKKKKHNYSTTTSKDQTLTLYRRNMAADHANSTYDRMKELKEFDQSKIGVKGLADSGITSIPRFFVHSPDTLDLKKPTSQTWTKKTVGGIFLWYGKN